MTAHRFDDCSIALLDTRRSNDFFRLIDANRGRLADYFAGTLAHTGTPEAAAGYCKLIEQLICDKAYFPYMITDKVTGAYIGLVDVKSVEWTVPKAELGYFIDESYAGQGIISWAMATGIDLIVREHRFKKLLCRVSPDNPASARVALKNDFELEGRIRMDYVTTSCVIVDLDYYGRVFTEEDLRARR